MPTLTAADLRRDLAAGELVQDGEYVLTFADLFDGPLPVTRSVRGNDAMIRVPSLLASQGVGYVLAVQADGVRISDVRFESLSQSWPSSAEKFGYNAIVASGVSRVSVERCQAVGMFNLLKATGCVGVVSRDCVVTRGYYGATVRDCSRAVIDNLVAVNVVRAMVVACSWHVRAGLLVAHDGTYPRLETPCLVIDDASAGECRDIRIDLTIDGVAWRDGQDLFRGVGVEFNLPSTAPARSMVAIDVSTRFVGGQGNCANIGFANHMDGAAQSSIGPRSFGEVIVRGTRRADSPLICARINPGVARLDLPPGTVIDETIRL